MARQLIEEMTAPWDADEFRDSFRDEIMRLVRQKAASGEAKSVEKVASAGEGGSAKPGAEIIDLTELLERSLQGGAKDKDSDGEPQATPAKAKPRTPRKRA